MSSNIKITRICESCSNEFIAKTTVTRYCSHKCNSRAYKKKLKSKKIAKSNEETFKKKTQHIEVLKIKEFLTVKDMTVLMNCSRESVYNLINSGKINSVGLDMKKNIIKRSELNRFIDNE